MQKALQDAVVARWNAAGLNTSIAALYLGADKSKAHSNREGSPVGKVLPRAEYWAGITPPKSKSRGSRVYDGLVEFEVFGDSPENVGTYVSSIHSTFMNCDAAGTSPMTISGGHCLEVDDNGSSVTKEDDKVWMGRLVIRVMLSFPNSTPA